MCLVYDEDKAIPENEDLSSPSFCDEKELRLLTLTLDCVRLLKGDCLARLSSFLSLKMLCLVRLLLDFGREEIKVLNGLLTSSASICAVAPINDRG